MINEIPVGIFHVSKAKLDKTTDAANCAGSAVYIPEIKVGISKYHHSVINYKVPKNPNQMYCPQATKALSKLKVMSSHES